MPVLPVHVVAGLIGIASGAVALFAVKGATLHRKSGAVFVYAMVAMASTGLGIAVLNSRRISVVAGALTLYLVATAYLTVRYDEKPARWMTTALAVIGLAISAAGFTFGVAGVRSATGTLDGLPPEPAFLFATIAVLAVIGDVRVMAGGIRGAQRLARHLWRMCFALFIATSSFFLGQPQVFPESLRDGVVLIALAVAPLVVLFYWLWRLRIGRANAVSS